MQVAVPGQHRVLTQDLSSASHQRRQQVAEAGCDRLDAMPTADGTMTAAPKDCICYVSIYGSGEDSRLANAIAVHN